LKEQPPLYVHFAQIIGSAFDSNVEFTGYDSGSFLKTVKGVENSIKM
jgi:hypothetical protein